MQKKTTKNKNSKRVLSLESYVEIWPYGKLVLNFHAKN